MDDFIASYRSHLPQSDSLNGKQKHSSEPDLKFLSEQANAFIESYHDFLNKLWNSTLSIEIKKYANDETLFFGGDKLFLPDTYREPMISAWLLWILRGDILEDDMRDNVLNNIFSKMIQSETYQQYPPETEEQLTEWKNLSFNDANFEREYPLEEKRIDILIKTSDSVIAIENKIGNKDFDKNTDYKKELEKEYPNKNRFYFLLVPRKDLDEYLEEESEEEDKKEKLDATPAPKQTKEQDAVLRAFPPVTWEEFLRILRKAIEENDNDNIRWKHWKTLALAFISCVEGNVLGFPLKDIKDIKESVNSSRPPLHLIQQINEYFKYRKL